MTNAAEAFDPSEPERPYYEMEEYRPGPTVDELLAMNIESPFESDEEWKEFLADLYASRRRDLA